MKELDWKILIVLYEKRSITKTAEALYLTQSAVTKRLQNMESEWGIEVIRRSSQGVAFTEDGTYLAQKASVMLDFLREIREHYAQRECCKRPLTVRLTFRHEKPLPQAEYTLFAVGEICQRSELPFQGSHFLPLFP